MDKLKRKMLSGIIDDEPEEEFQLNQDTGDGKDNLNNMLLELKFKK